jgi:hypothetical protein
LRGEQIGYGGCGKLISDVTHLPADTLHRSFSLFQSTTQLIHLFFFCLISKNK